MNYLTAQRLQSAADQAALSAARAYVADSKIDIQNEAEFIAGTAGFSVVDGATVTASNPPESGDFAGSTSHIEVTISAPEPRYFAGLFGDKPVIVTARAVSSFSKGSSTCLLALDGSASKAVNVSGGVQLNLENCDMQVNSTSLSALAGSGGAIIDADNVMVAGGASLSGGATVTTTGAYLLKAPTVADPLIGKVQPVPSTCKATGLSTSAPLTLYPGTYCGGLTVKSGGDVFLNPGVYVIDNGGLTVSGGGRLIGAGVTIFMTSSTGKAFGKVVFSGSSIVELTAPTTGSTAGLAIFGDRSMPLGTKFDFSGGANMMIDGFIYAPRAFLNWSGGSSVNSYCTTVIGNTVQFSGDAAFSTADCDKFGLFAGASAVTLVE